jgi:hypothetical protein
MLTRLMMTLALFIVLSGCQYFEVQSSQLGSIMTAFVPDSKALPDSRWSADFGGYSIAVQPIIDDKGTVFINNLDVIWFDGWRITKVKGLNSFNPAWEIRDTGNERNFFVNGRIVMKHQCDPWVKFEIKAGVRFEQYCVGKQSYTNTILVGSLGQITNIEQVVDSSFMALRLRLNKKG